jgi:glucosamine-phosphate N-acetyltransferase
MFIRELEVEDFKKRFAECLSALGETDFTNKEWLATNFVHLREQRFIKTFVMVSEDDDSIIGTASLLLEPKLIYGGKWAARIEDVAVRKDQQGKGVGRALVNHCIKVAKEKVGLYKIILHCSQQNVKFYEKMGFYQTSSYLMRIDIEEEKIASAPLTEDDLLKRIVAGDLEAVPQLYELCLKLKKDYVADRINRAMQKYLGKPEELINDVIRYIYSACPKCASRNTSVKNHSLMWHDGDITCDICETYVRMYDAG